jgi:predicted nuclease of predicted toxin-antitoxin system
MLDLKFLLDENISPKTAKFLKSLGYDVKTLFNFKMLGCENGEVANLAMRENRIIITLDLTFAYSFYFMNRGKVGIVLLRLEDLSVENVNKVLKSFLEKIQKEKKKVEKSLVIVEEEGYRIIK